MSDVKSTSKKRDRENEVDLSESKKPKSSQDETNQDYNYDYSQYYQYYQYPGYYPNAYDWSQYYSYYQQPQYGNMNYYSTQQQQIPQYQVNDNLKKFETQIPKTTIYRKAADKEWDDPTLADWPENDFRLFVGNLGNDVTDEVLKNAFSKYKSLAKVRVVRDKQDKSKGFGFVSLLDPKDFVAALKEMNGKYVGSRPCKVVKSDWKARNDYTRMRKK